MLLELLTEVAIKRLAGDVAGEVFKYLKKRSLFSKKLDELVNQNTLGHLTEVSNWTERIQFFGMNRGVSTEDKTIELDLDAATRKFSGERRGEEKLTELDILGDPNNYLLLGDPGSGKTTTIKRLARFVLKNPGTEKCPWKYPIVIRLRAASGSVSIYQAVASALGLRDIKTKRYFLAEDSGHAQGLAGEELVEAILPEVLDATGAVLFLDGFDELPTEERLPLETSIFKLALRVRSSKIILSCRSGYFVRNWDRFDNVEICPLEVNQIREIASKWLSEPDSFIEKVQGLPFFDLASRPLFLCQLIVFYRNRGYLPTQPHVVCRRTVQLLLEEWDPQRRIVRDSRYEGFTPESKMEFLAALSYRLTYKLKAKAFGGRDLQEAYSKICSHFGLADKRPLEIMREIEGHTGLIIENGPEHFEFSHLSLQEYLCGDYLARTSFTQDILVYLREYPPPIAIAISLSADPGERLARLILSRGSLQNIQTQKLASFLSRLLQEKPRFSQDIYLGFTVLAIIFKFGLEPGVEEYLEESIPLRQLTHELLMIGAVRSSTKEALEWYDKDEDMSNAERLWLKRKGGFNNRQGFILPSDGPFWCETFIFLNAPLTQAANEPSIY